MSASSSTPSPKRYLFLSVCGVVGAFLGWFFWFAAGGWQRQQHLAEAILWGVSSALGLIASIQVIRSDRDSSWITMLALPLAAFHVLALLLLKMFVGFLASGGPRP
jgi:hypothetical protein